MSHLYLEPKPHPGNPVHLTRYCYVNFTKGIIPENNPRDVFEFIYETLESSPEIKNLNKNKLNNSPYHFLLNNNNPELVQLNKHLLTRLGIKKGLYELGLGIIGMEIARLQKGQSEIEDIVASALIKRNWEKILLQRSSSILYIPVQKDLREFKTIKDIEEEATRTHISKTETYHSRRAKLSLKTKREKPKAIPEIFKL